MLPPLSSCFASRRYQDMAGPFGYLRKLTFTGLIEVGKLAMEH
jgi:hypothetical protein